MKENRKWKSKNTLKSHVICRIHHIKIEHSQALWLYFRWWNRFGLKLFIDFSKSVLLHKQKLCTWNERFSPYPVYNSDEWPFIISNPSTLIHNSPLSRDNFPTEVQNLNWTLGFQWKWNSFFMSRAHSVIIFRNMFLNVQWLFALIQLKRWFSEDTFSTSWAFHHIDKYRWLWHHCVLRFLSVERPFTFLRPK